MAGDPESRGPMTSLRCCRFCMTSEWFMVWSSRRPMPVVSTDDWAARGVTARSIRPNRNRIATSSYDCWLDPAGFLRSRNPSIVGERGQTRNVSPAEEPAVSKDSVTITDNRTGQTYELPITEGTIRATDLRQIKVAEDDFGMMTYDPAFMNTAACRSAITFIDGDKGILRYRGYPIEQLAEKATFLEVAYLLCEGELPNREQLAKWEDTIRYHTYVHTNITKFLEGFRYDAHPMGMLLGVVGALSTFYPDAKNIHDAENRYLQRVRLLAKLPTIAAFAFRHSRGLPYEFPDNDLDYIGNFVNMTFSIGGRHQPNKVLQRALEILLILHADHEQNCSTSAVRAV